MKLAVLGDLHAGVHKSHPAFANALQRFIVDFFIPQLERRQIKHVVQVGDVVDSRPGIRWVTMSHVRRNFLQPLLDAGIELHVLVGNHDAPHTNTLFPNAPDELFDGYPVRVYNQPSEAWIGSTRGLHCVMLPWICRDNHDQSLELLKRTKARVVFGHLELTGFDMYRGSPCRHGMNASLFRTFDLVASGHFHHPSDDGVIHYVGAPMQYTWADAGCARGFSVLDTETLQLEFVRNPDDMFIVYDKIEKIKPSDVKEKFVRVLTAGNSANEVEAFVRMIESFGASDVKSVDVPTNVVVEDLDIEDNIEGHEQTISRYVGAVSLPESSNLNKQRIEQILLDTYSESLTV